MVEHSVVRPDMAALKLAWDACYMPRGPPFPSHLLPPPSPPVPSLPSSADEDSVSEDEDGDQWEADVSFWAERVLVMPLRELPFALTWVPPRVNGDVSSIRRQ